MPKHEEESSWPSLQLALVVCLALSLLNGCHKNLKKELPLAALQVTDRSQAFSNVFCAVLSKENRPDGRAWGRCSAWLDAASPQTIDLPPSIETTYRFLLVAGFGSDCLTGPNATFMDSIAHLELAHTFRAETVPVSAFGSSEFNATQIADYLAGQFASDTRKYIVLGYSKGLADLQVAIADRPNVRDKVAALVTLSGVVQGSRLTEAADADVRMVLQGELANCSPGDMKGIESMRPSVRKAFLAQHPDPLVPTYSVVAYSKYSKTSRILIPFWDTLAEYGQVEDSQMIAAEAIYPRGTYLGLLTRDHWAIAIPFDKSFLVNKGEFPRPQLFEAILRFIIEDLKTQPIATTSPQQ